MCSSLQSQIGVARRSIEMHRGVPEGFATFLAEATARLQDGIDNFRAELCAELERTGKSSKKGGLTGGIGVGEWACGSTCIGEEDVITNTIPGISDIATEGPTSVTDAVANAAAAAEPEVRKKVSISEFHEDPPQEQDLETGCTDERRRRSSIGFADDTCGNEGERAVRRITEEVTVLPGTSTRGSAVQGIRSRRKANSKGSAVSSLSSGVSAKKRMSLRDQLVDVTGEELESEDDPQGAFVNGVMNPNWPWRLAWDLGVILLVVCDAMVLPYQFAYSDSSEPGTFDTVWLWLTTTFFLSDMVLSFFTGYTAGDKAKDAGKLVTSRCRIARNYLQSWFLIDFCSTIPWGPLASSLSGGGGGSGAQVAKLTKIFKFIRFLRLMRMLRLAKLAMIWERVEARMGSLILKQSVALLRVILVLVIICHWNACIWWMIGQPKSMFTEMMSDAGRLEWETERHWTTVRRGRIGSNETWTWLDKEPGDQYIFCFYWTLGVMRTMPAEVQPENKVERVYVMCFMFFAFSAFAICVALITQTFFKFSERKRAYDDDMAQVRGYMRSLKQGGASEKLQGAVKTYLRHLFDTRKTHAKEQGLINMLPKALQGQLKFEKLSMHLEKHLTILQDLPSKAIYYICDIVEVRDVPSNTCLCREHRMSEACWIRVNGRLNPNDHIIDMECLLSTRNTVSQRTIHTLTPTELLRIDKLRFMKLISENAEFMDSLNLMVESNMVGAEVIDHVFVQKNSMTEATAATTASIAC